MKFKIIAVFAIIFATSDTMFAQSADASAELLPAIYVTKATDLSFGNIAAGTSESTVTIAADVGGNRALATGDAALVSTDEGGSAKFFLSGLINAEVNLTVDASIWLSDISANSMLVVPALSATNVTLSSGGAGECYVGGTLTVGANQPSGYYQSLFTVTAEYQ